MAKPALPAVASMGDRARGWVGSKVQRTGGRPRVRSTLGVTHATFPEKFADRLLPRWRPVGTTPVALLECVGGVFCGWDGLESSGMPEGTGAWQGVAAGAQHPLPSPRLWAAFAPGCYAGVLTTPKERWS